MRDRAAKRAAPARALDVDMDPLRVAGALRELVDHRLVDRDPVRDAKFLPDQPVELFICGWFDLHSDLAALA